MRRLRCAAESGCSEVSFVAASSDDAGAVGGSGGGGGKKGGGGGSGYGCGGNGNDNRGHIRWLLSVLQILLQLPLFEVVEDRF